MLSAQATDAGVNKATPALFALADTPQKMLALGEERVRDLIKTIGLYRTKAKNVIGLSKALVERHDGEVPREREALEALPGVGRKTANVVLNIAFGEPTIAVDTHIFRVGNRTGLAPGKTPHRSRDGSREGRARAIQAPRPSLADPAWALCVHGAQAQMLACLITDICLFTPKTACIPLEDVDEIGCRKKRHDQIDDRDEGRAAPARSPRRRPAANFPAQLPSLPRRAYAASPPSRNIRG